MLSDDTPLDPPPLLQNRRFWITLAAVIPLLAVGAYCLENWLGARELARVKTEVAAAGIDLDLRRIPSIRPPDAENFCFTPLLLAIGSGTVTGPEFQTIERIAYWRNHISKHNGHLQSPSKPTPTDWLLTRDAIAAEDDDSGVIKGGPTPLADLASALDRDLAPVFAELSAALPRPLSVLVPTVREKLQSGQDLSTISISQRVEGVYSLGTALNLRARNDLATGREGRAAETVRILLKLAEGVEADNHLDTFFVGNLIRLTSLETTWVATLSPQGIPAQEWLKLSAAFRARTGLDRMSELFRFEMFRASVANSILRQDAKQLAVAIDWEVDPSSTFFSPGPTSRLHWQGALVDLIPDGWMDFNLARTLEGNLKLLERVTDPKQHQRFNDYANSDWIKTSLSSKSGMGHALFAGSSLAMVSSSVASLARHSVLCRLAESACALEAYHAHHGAYPPTLLTLVPDFLPAVPADLNGQPVRYAPDPANGRYTLWSIGADDRDDGGVEKPHPAGRPDRKPRPWNEPVGDWVWQYPK